MDNEKQKALEAALSKIRKRFWERGCDEVRR